MKRKMMGWQWHQLHHMQIICTSLQSDNHAGTSSLVFTMPHHARAIYVVVMRLSVCLSQVSVLLKWVNVGSHKEPHMIAHGL